MINLSSFSAHQWAANYRRLFHAGVLAVVGALVPWFAYGQVFDAFLQPEVHHPSLPTGPGGSWFSEPEVRIKPEINNGSSNSANYSVRFRPRGNNQRRLDQELFELENSQLLLQWQQHYAELVRQRYLSVLTLAEAEAELWQLEQRRIAERSRVSTAQALATGRNRFAGASPEQQAILRLSLAEAAVLEQRKKVVLLRQETVGAYFEPRADDFGLSSRLVRPAEVRDRLTKMRTPLPSAPRALLAAQLNSDHAARRLALAKTESRFGLSLVELGYDDKQNDSYNLTLGFRLPGKGASGGESRRARELIKAEQQAHLATELYDHQLQSRLSALELELEYFDLRAQALTRHRSQIARVGGGEAAAQQLLNEHEWALQSKLITQHAKVLSGYIDLLSFTGQLYPSPTNWLRGENQ